MIVTKEGTDTRTFAVENIVLGPNAEVVSRKVERYIREVFTCVAFDGVDPVGVSCGTHLFISGRYKSRGEQKRNSEDHT